LIKISNLLEALKHEVQFFDDKEFKGYVKKIKKYFELKAKIPGIAEAKWGTKEE